MSIETQKFLALIITIGLVIIIMIILLSSEAHASSSNMPNPVVALNIVQAFGNGVLGK